ncbi:MAG: T9SS type A sorting domain-containing protein [Bacteroidia bacterium]|nr:T9SS type A sorting domain-containing protein [Bacteroidia bacterium]
MKNKYASSLAVFVFAILFSLSVANAQSAFSVDPGTTVSETVTVNPNDSVYTDLTIHLKNETNNPLVLEWKTMSNTLPSAWNLQLCDWTKCFSDVIPGRVMDTIGVGVTGFMKLSIGPIYPNTVGSGSCIFDVWVRGDTNDKVTLHFDIDALVGLEENILESNVVVYPNPVKNTLFLNSGTISLDQVTLYDLSGAKVAQINTPVTGDAQLSTSALAPGLYLLEVKSGAQVMTKKILKTE